MAKMNSIERQKRLLEDSHRRNEMTEEQYRIAKRAMVKKAKGGKIRALKKLIPVELFRSVSDYGADFEKTINSPFTEKERLAHILELLDEVGIDSSRASEIQLKGPPKFLEFDSTNPGHASGYFEAQLEVPIDLAKSFEGLGD